MLISVAEAVLLLDVVVFTAYVVDVLIRFGIPANLSITYYHYERQYHKYGNLFPALMVLVCCTTVPIWILTTWNGSLLARWFVAMPIITEFSLLFVAFSARYKRRRKLIYYHYACAIVAAVCAVLWMCFVANQIPLIALRIGLLLGCLSVGSLTHTLKSCILFWLELAAFYSIFFTLFLIHSVPFDI